MQKAVKYTGVNNRISPATVKLLIRERNKGKSLRQLGQMFGRSHERVLEKVSPILYLGHELYVTASKDIRYLDPKVYGKH